VDLPRTKGALLSLDTAGGMEVYRAEPYASDVPILWVAFDNNAAVRLPLFENEGAVADEVFGPCPRVPARVRLAGFFERGQVNGKPDRLGEEREEVRDGVVECDDEGARVRRREADIFKIAQSAVVRLCVLNEVERRRVVGGKSGREDACVARQKVLRGQRRGAARRPKPPSARRRPARGLGRAGLRR